MKKALFRLLIFFCVLQSTGCLVSNSDWPSERGNLSNSNFNVGVKPSKISEVLWKFKSDDYISTNPVVYKDVVIFGSNNSLLALNKETGELIWEFGADFSLGSYNDISSTPTVCDGRVFFGSNVGTFYALNVYNGKILWKTEMDDRISSSPKVSGGVVYFGCEDGFLYAYNIETGLEKWRYRTINSISGPPAIIDGHIIVITKYGIYSVNSRSGELSWSKELTPDFSNVPITSDDLIYLNTLDDIYALDKNSGKEVFHYQFPQDSAYLVDPCLANRKLICYSVHRQKLFALDLKSGDLIWEKDVDSELKIADSPLVVGNNIFLPIGWELIAFNVDDGKELWRKKIDTTFSTLLAIAGKTFYFGSADKFLVSMR